MKNNKSTDREMLLAELASRMADGPTSTLDDTFDSKLDDLTNEELQQLYAVGRFVRTLENVCLREPNLDGANETGNPADTDVNHPANKVPSRPDSVPPNIGKFIDLKLAAQGGFANIYQAFDPDLQRYVALKIPHSERLQTASLRERFRREGRAAAILSHNAIVPVFDAGSVDGFDYISSEWVDGTNLQQWLKVNSSPVPVTEAAASIERLADGIATAHARKILHRDIKPANVMVAHHNSETPGRNWFQNLKVTDFGLARDLESPEDAKRLTTEGSIMGTPAYMSPEQARCDEGIGPATDVFALGSVLYELLTGAPPHLRSSYTATLLAIENDSVSPIKKSRRDVPVDLRAICMKCLEFRPADRYPTARELSDDLARFRNGQPVAARPVGVAGKLLRWSKRNPAIAASLGLTILSLLAGLLVTGWFLRQSILDQRVILAAQQESERQSDIKQEALDSILGSFKRANPVFSGQNQLSPADILNASRMDIRSKFAGDQLAQARLLSGLAVAYMGIGLQAEAVNCREEASRLFDECIGPLEPEAMQELQRLAHNQMYSGQLQESFESHRDLLLRCQQLDEKSPGFEKEAIFSLAELQLKLGQFEDSIATLSFRNKETIQYGETRQKLLLIKSLREAGYLDQALETSKSYWQLLDEKKGPDAVMTLNAKREYVLALTDADMFDQAIPLAGELLQTWTRLRGPDSIRAMEQSRLNGWLLLHANETDAAEALVTNAIMAGRERYGPTHTLVLHLKQIEAHCREQTGDIEGAIEILGETIGQRTVQSRLPNPITLQLVRDLARIYRNNGRPEQAIELLTPYLQFIAQPHDLEAEEVIRLRTEYIQSFAEAGDAAEVISLSRRHLESLENRKSPPVDVRYANFQLINLLLQNRDFENAIKETEMFIEKLEHSENLSTRLKIETYSLLATAQLEQGDYKQAAKTARIVLSDRNRFEPYKSLMLAVMAAGMAHNKQYQNGEIAQASMLGVLKRDHFADSSFSLRFLMLLTAERLRRSYAELGNGVGASMTQTVIDEMKAEMFGQ